MVSLPDLTFNYLHFLKSFSAGLTKVVLGDRHLSASLGWDLTKIKNSAALWYDYPAMQPSNNYTALGRDDGQCLLSWGKLRGGRCKNNYWVHLNGKLYQTPNHHTITNRHLLVACQWGGEEKKKRAVQSLSFLLTKHQNWLGRRLSSFPLFYASVPWKMPNESEQERGEMTTLKSLLMHSLWGGRDELNFKYCAMRNSLLPEVLYSTGAFKNRLFLSASNTKPTTHTSHQLVYVIGFDGRICGFLTDEWWVLNGFFCHNTWHTEFFCFNYSWKWWWWTSISYAIKR